MRALESDPKFFFRNDAFEKVGLGKNMVQSLRHWLITIEAVHQSGIGKDRTLNFTSFGKWLLKNDPSLKYMDTLAMIHYNITYSSEPSSTWYWFFNVFNETAMNKESVFNELKKWVEKRETRKVSPNSVQRDVDCLLSMYEASDEPEDPEETIFSPFSKLKLLIFDDGVWIKNKIDNISDNPLFIKYALCKYSNVNDQYEISLNEILNGPKLLGKIYHMDSNDVLDVLHQLEKDPLYTIRFTRTNNLDTIRLPYITEEELLKIHSY